MSSAPFADLRLKPGEKPTPERLAELFDGLTKNFEDSYELLTGLRNGTGIEAGYIKGIGGSKKIATGLSSWTWTASTLSATKLIAHGLGVVPTFVGLTPVFEPNTVFIVPRLTGTPTKTEFGSCAVLSLSSSTTIPFQWVAIG